MTHHYQVVITLGCGCKVENRLEGPLEEPSIEEMLMAMLITTELMAEEGSLIHDSQCEAGAGED